MNQERSGKGMICDKIIQKSLNRSTGSSTLAKLTDTDAGDSHNFSAPFPTSAPLHHHDDHSDFFMLYLHSLLLLHSCHSEPALK